MLLQVCDGECVLLLVLSRQASRMESLVKIGQQILDVFQSDRDSNEIVSDAVEDQNEESQSDDADS